MLNFDFWDKEWPVITGAPHTVLGGIAIIFVAAFLIVRWAYTRELAGRTAEIAARVAENAALTARLQLAADEQKTVTREVDSLKSQTAKLTEQIKMQIPLREIASTVAGVTGTAGRLSDSNAVLGSTLTQLGPTGYVPPPGAPPARITSIRRSDE